MLDGSKRPWMADLRPWWIRYFDATLREFENFFFFSNTEGRITFELLITMIWALFYIWCFYSHLNENKWTGSRHLSSIDPARVVSSNMFVASLVVFSFFFLSFISAQSISRQGDSGAGTLCGNDGDFMKLERSDICGARVSNFRVSTRDVRFF